MSKFSVSPEKEAELYRQMSKLQIREVDLEEQFIRGTGPGGQKINKTASCVYLKHIPSGIEVKCQASRSQALNRYLARRELCEKLGALISGEKSRKRNEQEKIKRQKRRRSRRSKLKMLANKKKRSDLKKTRAKPSAAD